MKKLIKWREERKRKKQLDNTKRKPVFKVGIVHHALYSPASKDMNVTMLKSPSVKSPKQIKHPDNVQKRITRATEKRLLAKAAAATKQVAVASKNAALKNLVKQSVNIKRPIDTKKQKSFAPTDHAFRPPSGLPKMPLFGLVAVEQTPSEKGDFFVQDKSKECKTHDANDQKDALPQESSVQTSDPTNTTNTTAISKGSISSKFSLNERKLQQKSNRRSACDLNDATPESNQAKICRLSRSLDKQTMQNSSQEEKASSDNIDMETPLQKTPLTSESSGKRSCDKDLIVFSPYLTLSRGKNNARKEQQMRLGIGRSSSDEIPTKDTVMKNLNISVEEEERTAQYFKFLLNKETERLQELCNKWLDIRSEQDVPEDAMYEISQAVGQTNLLISKKFERFRGLVLDCETGRGEMLVTCRDLQGFWDMTCMEVKDCDSRFEKLEQRRNRYWQEEQSTAVKPIAKKRMSAKKQISSSKPSSLRSFLAARRKKMTATPDDEGDSLLKIANTNKGRITPPLNGRKSVAFKENTNTRLSAKKSIGRKSTPARRSNVGAGSAQKPRYSDTSKIMKSPFTIMKISQMCKTSEVQINDTVSYVNSDQTPGKSILKKSEELIDKDARIKSAHKVNFDDQIVLNEVPVDEETRTKINLAVALDRIDNLDLDDLSPVECVNVEKKLIFETEDSDSSDEWMSEIHAQLEKKQNKSKSSIQKALYSSNMHPLNDITSAISFEESSLNNNAELPEKKDLRRRTRRRSAIDDNTLGSSLKNVLPATPLRTNIETPEAISNKAMTEREQELEIRTLRNRVIMTNDTPKANKMVGCVIMFMYIFFIILFMYIHN